VTIHIQSPPEVISKCILKILLRNYHLYLLCQVTLVLNFIAKSSVLISVEQMLSSDLVANFKS
jgi:hypothetical protein